MSDYESFLQHGGLTEKPLKELSHKDQVRFALFCANQVQEHWCKEPICVKAIELVELWLEDKATTIECYEHAMSMNNIINRLHDMRDKGCDTEERYYRSLLVVDYAIYGAGSAANGGLWSNNAKIASNASYYAFTTTTDAALIHAQIAYYNELRYIDENFQRIVLEGE